MKLSLKRMICHFMVFAMAMLPFQSGQASMIGVDQVVSSSAASGLMETPGVLTPLNCGHRCFNVNLTPSGK